MSELILQVLETYLNLIATAAWEPTEDILSSMIECKTPVSEGETRRHLIDEGSDTFMSEL